MKGPKYRLSPNEVEQLVKEERQKRRKLRILQVREQAKLNAASVRNDVRREKDRLLQNMAEEIKTQLEAEKKEKLQHLEQKYESMLHSIGEGHREAHSHGDVENKAEKLKKLKEGELAAQERFRQAMELKKTLDSQKRLEKNKHILARKAALEAEKERASQIASLPPPPPDISVELEKVKRIAIPMINMKSFATTHYHIPDYHVIKAGTEEQGMYDAKKNAEEEDLRLKQDLEAKKRSKHEQIEKARIRGNEALHKEILKHDLGDMLKDLSLLQKKDRRRRQGIVTDLPKQMFIPPEKCLEERQEKQKEMEAKFDELYIQHCKVDGEDLHSLDVTEYLTTTDSTENSAVDSTPDVSIPISRINPALRDLTNVTRPQEPAQHKKPETVLRQLLNRIKEQRDGGTHATVQKESGAGLDQDKPRGDLKAASSTEPEDQTDQSIPDATVHLKERQFADMIEPLTTEKETDFKKVEKLAEKSAEPSDPDKTAITNNNKMIEDLLKRIQLIEAQKEQLTNQFKAHSGFLNQLRQEDIVELDQTNCSSQKEVDIGQIDDHKKKLQLPQIDHSVFEKLPDQEGHSTQHSGQSYLRENYQKKPDLKVNSASSNMLESGLSSQLWKPWQTSGVGSESEVDLNRKFITRENRVTFNLDPQKSVQFLADSQDLVIGGQGKAYIAPDETLKLLPSERFSLLFQEAKDRKRSQTEDTYPAGGTLDQKLLEYTEKVKAKQANLDEDTIRRVREYQQTLFQTHEERKKLLADVRADIEKRRQELKLAVPSAEAIKVLPSYLLSTPYVSQDVRKPMPPYFPPPPHFDRDVSDVVPYSMASSGLYAKDDLYKDWEPIKPFIAEPRSSQPASNFNYTTWLYRTEEPVSNKAAASRDGEHSEMSMTLTRTDKLRRSLPFQDGDESFSYTWNNTPASKSSQDHSNSSRVYSSEEDRGSPILSDKSKLSDNESFSAGLVAKAAESRRDFMLRQGELQSQLLEIQRQKDAIQERYSAGQLALQQQQLALKSKLARAAEELGSRPTVVKDRLVGVPMVEPLLQRSWDILSAPRSDLSAFDVAPHPGSSFFDDSRASDGPSGRLSQGTPGNLSSDSYLADISYQKIKANDFKSLPASAFAETKVMGQFANIAKPIPVLGSSQPSTWASLLKSSAGVSGQSKPLGDQQALKQDFAQQTASFSSAAAPLWPPSSLPLGQAYFLNQPAQFESIQDVMRALTNSSSQVVSPGLSDHQPHELSTILEVDTPMSISGKSMIRRHGGSVTNTLSSNHSSLTTSSANPDFRLDVFKETYTLAPKAGSSDLPGAIFNLSRLEPNFHRDDSSTGQPVVNEREQLQLGLKLGAKRTLNFSDETNTPQKSETSFLEDEDLSSIQMPPLVEATPIKPLGLRIDASFLSDESLNLASMTSSSNDRLSSVSSTACSQHLSTRCINGTGITKDVTLNTSLPQTSADIKDTSLPQTSADIKDTSFRTDTSVDSQAIAQVLLQAKELNPSLLWQLQQRSKAVFGDSSDIPTSGNSETLSGSITLAETTISDQVEAVTSALGNSEAPLGSFTTELEEVTLSDVAQMVASASGNSEALSGFTTDELEEITIPELTNTTNDKISS